LIFERWFGKKQKILERNTEKKKQTTTSIVYVHVHLSIVHDQSLIVSLSLSKNKEDGQST
jgi:hypothetical protein